jgi:hypothetical protein
MSKRKSRKFRKLENNMRNLNNQNKQNNTAAAPAPVATTTSDVDYGMNRFNIINTHVLVNDAEIAILTQTMNTLLESLSTASELQKTFIQIKIRFALQRIETRRESNKNWAAHVNKYSAIYRR